MIALQVASVLFWRLPSLNDPKDLAAHDSATRSYEAVTAPPAKIKTLFTTQRWCLPTLLEQLSNLI